MKPSSLLIKKNIDHSYSSSAVNFTVSLYFVIKSISPLVSDEFENVSPGSGVLALYGVPYRGPLPTPPKLPSFVVRGLPPGLRQDRAAGGKGQHQVSAVPRDSPP